MRLLLRLCHAPRNISMQLVTLFFRRVLASLSALLGIACSPALAASDLNVTLSGAGSGTITSSPAGIACGVTCSASFISATNVTLTATPASGSAFAGWSGACTGTAACTVSINGAQNVTATFKPEPFKAVLVTDGLAGAAGGIIPGTEPCNPNNIPGFTCAGNPYMTVATTISFNSADVGKSGAVFVTATVPSGSLVQTQLPNSINQFVLVQLTSMGWQQVVDGQLIPYASGVLGDQLAAITILNKNTNTLTLNGSQFCVGYGTSASEMTAAGRMQMIAFIANQSASNPGCIVDANSSVTLDFVGGWNLVGNSSSSALDVVTAFGDASKVSTVWKWIANGTKWVFYAPSLVGQALTDYAISKGYDVLKTINGGEGFWVNANTAFTTQLPVGSTVTSASFQSMGPGWNLIVIGDSKVPSQFNALTTTTTPLTTLWAWDNAQAKWYFYAPSLEAQGGTALTDYITSKGYLDFTANNKTLGPGVGFWVNKP